MSLLAGASTATNAVKDADTLGGFKLVETGAHKFTIETAYMHTSASGARAIAFAFKNDADKLNTTVYYTSGEAKGLKTFYIGQDGKEHNLPGFILCDDICKLVTGKALGSLSSEDIEEKVIKLRNYDTKQDEPTKVNMIMPLIGQEIVIAVEKQEVDKTAKGDDGTYKPTGEVREQNEAVKAFHPENYMTVNEADAGAEDAAFVHLWVEKNEGKLIKKAKGAKDGATAGAPKAAAPKKKLFA